MIQGMFKEYIFYRYILGIGTDYTGAGAGNFILQMITQAVNVYPLVLQKLWCISNSFL